jgi:hypothetical protein
LLFPLELRGGSVDAAAVVVVVGGFWCSRAGAGGFEEESGVVLVLELHVVEAPPGEVATGAFERLHLAVVVRLADPGLRGAEGS